MTLNLDLIDILIGIAIALISAISFLIRQREEFRIAGKNLRYDISGDWYSAELDFKQPELGNAILKIHIKRKKLGNKVIIKTQTQMNRSDVKRETAWITNGKIVTLNTLSADWIGTIDNSIRFGNVFLQFIENERAIGYWIGYASKKAGQPVYGYGILSRNLDDVHELAKIALEKFVFIDVKYLVENKDNEIFKGDYWIKK